MIGPFCRRVYISFLTLWEYAVCFVNVRDCSVYMYVVGLQSIQKAVFFGHARREICFKKHAMSYLGTLGRASIIPLSNLNTRPDRRNGVQPNVGRQWALVQHLDVVVG